MENNWLYFFFFRKISDEAAAGSPRWLERCSIFNWFFDKNKRLVLLERERERERAAARKKSVMKKCILSFVLVFLE